MSASPWNKKVATRRGNAWKEALSQGKFDIQVHPSKLRIVRVRKGIHQVTLADQVGVSHSTYCSIERGKRRIKPMIAEKIAAILGMKIAELFQRDEDFQEKYRVVFFKNLF